MRVLSKKVSTHKKNKKNIKNIVECKSLGTLLVWVQILHHWISTKWKVLISRHYCTFPRTSFVFGKCLYDNNSKESNILHHSGEIWFDDLCDEHDYYKDLYFLCVLWFLSPLHCYPHLIFISLPLDQQDGIDIIRFWSVRLYWLGSMALLTNTFLNAENSSQVNLYKDYSEPKDKYLFSILAIRFFWRACSLAKAVNLVILESTHFYVLTRFPFKEAR